MIIEIFNDSPMDVLGMVAKSFSSDPWSNFSFRVLGHTQESTIGEIWSATDCTQEELENLLDDFTGYNLKIISI